MMKKDDYVWIVENDGCLSTESFHDLEAVFATEEGAKQCMRDCASQLIASIDQYVDFEKGYDVYEEDAYWEVTSKKWSDLYIRYFYERVLVQ
jgi:hypothetical protein